MSITTIAAVGSSDTAYSLQQVRLGNGYNGFEWTGRAVLTPGTNFTNVNVTRFSDAAGRPPLQGLSTPAGAFITRVEFLPLSAITLAAGTGGLVVCPYLLSNAAGEDQVAAKSVQAVANVLAAPSAAYSWANSSPGGAKLTNVADWKVYAVTNITAPEGTSFTPSTMSVAAETSILVRICGYIPTAFPLDHQVNKARVTI